LSVLFLFFARRRRRGSGNSARCSPSCRGPESERRSDRHLLL
jgi:hypothetical protein